MLNLQLKKNQWIVFKNSKDGTIIKIKRHESQYRLAIDAPRHIEISREIIK